MIVARPARIVFAATLCLLSINARPATAQFGRLKKALGSTATSAASQTVAGAVPLMPVDRLEGLTATDVDQLLKGFDAEIAAWPTARKEADEKQKQRESDQKAYDKARSDYDKASARYEPCRAKWQAEYDKDNASADARIQANAPVTDEARLTQLAQRAQVAGEHMAAGTATAADQKAMADFQQATMQMQKGVGSMMQEVQKKQQANTVADARLVKTCGAEPVSPKSPEGLDWDPVRIVMTKGAAAAGMDEASYRIKRETLIAYRGSKVTAKRYSQAEADALNAKLDSARERFRTMEQAKIPL